MAVALRSPEGHFNEHPAEAEPNIARDKAGMTIWKARAAKQPTKDAIRQFEQQYGIKFFDWAKEAGLLTSTGMETLKAEDIIKEMEEK